MTETTMRRGHVHLDLNAVGRGTVAVDGIEQLHTRALTVRVEVGEPTRVEIDHIAADVTAELQAEVRRVLTFDADGEMLTGEGATLAAACRHLAEQLEQ